MRGHCCDQEQVHHPDQDQEQEYHPDQGSFSLLLCFFPAWIQVGETLLPAAIWQMLFHYSSVQSVQRGQMEPFACPEEELQSRTPFRFRIPHWVKMRRKSTTLIFVSSIISGACWEIIGHVKKCMLNPKIVHFGEKIEHFCKKNHCSVQLDIVLLLEMSMNRKMLAILARSRKDSQGHPPLRC